MMSELHKALSLVGRLYEAREFLQRMSTAEEYRARIAEYQGYIRQGAAKWKLSELETMIRLASGLKGSPMAQAGLFAAYVEMVETQTAV